MFLLFPPQPNPVRQSPICQFQTRTRNLEGESTVTVRKGEKSSDNRPPDWSTALLWGSFMPSGVKKRNPAKKKKRKQHRDQAQLNSSSGSAQFREDCVKHQADQKIDGGDTSSSASQDSHNGHHYFSMEGEDEKTCKEENIVVEEEGIVHVEREIKINDESNKMYGKIEHDVPATKSGSYSCSNDIESSPARADTAPVIDSVKKDESSPGKLTKYLSIFAAEGVTLADIPILENILFFREKAAVNLSSRHEKYVTAYNSVPKESKAIQSNDIEHVLVLKECVSSETDGRLEQKEKKFDITIKLSSPSLDAASERKKERTMIQSHENANATAVSVPKECVSLETDGRLEQKECAPLESGDRSEPKKCVSSESNDILGQKECISLESGDRSEPKVCASSESDDRLEPKSVPSVSDERLEAKECVSSESDDRISLSYYLPIDNRAEHDEESGVNQRVQASPDPMQATSWKSYLASAECDDRLEPKYVSSVSDDRLEAKDCVSSESDDRLSFSFYLPIDNRAEHDEDSGVNQHVQASPHPMQATSWKSCCGLFEFFTGCSR